MTTRDDIIAAIRGVDERLDALRDRIIERGDRPLPEGTWHVRDVLSHLAARANGVDRVVQRLRAAEAGVPAAPPRNVDEINAGQVEERRDATVVALLDEIRAGHAAAITALAHVDDATLAKMLAQGFRPGESPVADMILRGGPSHDNTHLDQVEAAIAEG
ncbi:MAG: maleylpyruvate isomerase N-terminal domain-containing protein [Dehalococcoidia bacterium]